MARITVEDCVKKIDRFKLVIIAAQRVREIEGGAPLTVPRENDKFPVVALREVAQGSLDFEKLEAAFVRTFQKHKTDDDWEDKILDEDPILAASEGLEDMLLDESFDNENSEDEPLTEEPSPSDSLKTLDT